MILKIIHSSFEIDLLDTEVDFTEPNHWFENDFKIKYTLPFTTVLTDELDQKLGMISHHNSTNASRYLEVKFYKYNRTYDAKLFIERLQNRELTASIEYGLDELPNFSKKLAELPLDNFEIAQGSLQAHALTIIGQSYPDVNYNFPKLKLPEDVISTEDNKWLYFKGYLNNYDGTNFLTNTFDLGNNEPVNENIMQPMPYLLHVLKKGFEDAGYNLQGEILQDPEYQHALINVLSKYYINVITTSQEWLVTQDMFQPAQTVNTFGYYEETIPIVEDGLYRIIGNGYLRRNGNSAFIKLEFISQSGFANEIFFLELPILLGQVEETFVEIDIYLQVFTSNLPGTLKLTSENRTEFDVNGETLNDLPILDVSVTKVAEFNNEELVYQALIQPLEINLPKCVPDITFGDFVKALMKHRNYDISVADDVVIMNKVETKVKEPSSQDLSPTEVRFPEIEFLEQKSYLLKFQNLPENFNYNPVLVTNSDIYFDELQKNENTEEIQINLLPLKIDEENTINTSILHTDAVDKIFLSLYDGTVSANNWSQSNLPLLLEHSFNNYYKEWLRFIILAKIFTWSNVLPMEKAFDVDVYKKAYAYNLNLTLKQVILRTINRNYCSVEFEAYSSF